MDTEIVTTLSNNVGDLCPKMDGEKISESLKDTEAKVTALELSDGDDNKYADMLQILFKTYFGKTQKRCKRKQPTNPLWRRSGRRWQPTSIYMRDRTPPRRRPPSSTDTDSCERPAVRGRSPIRRPPKSKK